MSLGDGVDDGEAETVAVTAAITIGRQLLEGLEEPLDLAAGDDWPASVTVRVTCVPEVWVVIWTCPSGWLWRMALSMRLAMRLSISLGSRPSLQALGLGEVDAFLCCLVAAGGEHPVTAWARSRVSQRVTPRSLVARASSAWTSRS